MKNLSQQFNIKYNYGSNSFFANNCAETTSNIAPAMTDKTKDVAIPSGPNSFPRTIIPKTSTNMEIRRLIKTYLVFSCPSNFEIKILCTAMGITDKLRIGSNVTASVYSGKTIGIKGGIKNIPMRVKPTEDSKSIFFI